MTAVDLQRSELAELVESAWIYGDVVCPECGQTLTDLVKFAWGGLLSDDINSGPVYWIGAWLLWFCDNDGIVHGDSRVSGTRGVNVGDPRVENVDVYDRSVLPNKCPECGLRLFGSRVSIRAGVIRRVAAVPAGEHDASVQAAEVDPRTEEVVQTFDHDRPIATALGST